jgi:hypothetical protein
VCSPRAWPPVLLARICACCLDAVDGASRAPSDVLFKCFFAGSAPRKWQLLNLAAIEAAKMAVRVGSVERQALGLELLDVTLLVRQFC